MGRRAIPIKQIDDERKRHVTFGKRKNGLMKKIMELSILCKSNCLMVIYDEHGNLFEYSSKEDPQQILNMYITDSRKEHEKFNNNDFSTFFENKNKKMSEEKEKPKRTVKKVQYPRGSTKLNFGQPATQLRRIHKPKSVLNHLEQINGGNFKSGFTPPVSEGYPFPNIQSTGFTPTPGNESEGHNVFAPTPLPTSKNEIPSPVMTRDHLPPINRERRLRPSRLVLPENKEKNEEVVIMPIQDNSNHVSSSNVKNSRRDAQLLSFGVPTSPLTPLTIPDHINFGRDANIDKKK